ncbi:MAG TPA: carotenoid biosynthesis protein [Ktedonobacteraceae bacterium]|nr:carotenoid biosynthesis protein [Ktedonobacteraceae bacterium]
MKIVKILFFCHLAALLFGLGGLLIALPHPELWDNNPFAVEVFNFGIRYAGSLHILFGAAAVLLFGLIVVGTRKTLIFFVIATMIPLGMELLGTSTGFPFGAYSYTSFLGFKIVGLVPYSIPLSWFYMGFTSFILANVIVASLQPGHRTAWSLALSVYFLTVWDLSLDPAMASQGLPIHFWIWHRGGPYFGMPISNLIGWSLTGLVYMGFSRLLWRANLDTSGIAVWFPFGMYVANTGFAIALNLSTGLWIPVLIALVLGLIPASLALRLRPIREVQQSPTDEPRTSIAKRISLLTIDAGSGLLVRRKAQVMVEGLEYVPRSGPVLIAARHFHHLYDGCVLLHAVPRRLHIFVALDWVQRGWLCGLMEWACAMVDWPAMLRIERLNRPTGDNAKTGTSAYSRSEATGYLRRSVRDAVRLLRNGEVLVIFPEAYPNIDPAPTLKKEKDTFLPFRPGFAKLVEMAERDGHIQVAIIPVGFTYVRRERWYITLRFGPGLLRDDYLDSSQLVQAVEKSVRCLSDQRACSAPTCTEEVIH